MQTPTQPRPVADRFAGVIEGLRRAIAARGAGNWLAWPLLALLWGRLHRAALRFARLAALVHAGRLPPPRHRTRSPRPVQPPPLRLPRGFAWLVRRVPQAAAAASQLQHLLADPAMADLLASAPQAGRLLRPLCQMLGVRPPSALGRPPPLRPAPPSRPAVHPRPTPPAAQPRRLTPPATCPPPVRA